MSANDKMRKKILAISGLEVGNAQSGNYLSINEAGDLRLYGTATQFEDLRVDGLLTTKGLTSPTDEGGFRGNANMYMRSMVHTQADEVYFIVQLPHAYKVGSDLHPHVHFSPEVSGSNGNQASFVLEYYPTAIGSQSPATSSSLLMTASWTGDKQWYHFIATEQDDIDGTNLGFSSILHCRLYRDNTGACNLQGKVAFEYFDIHYEVDSFGSSSEYIK